MPGSFSPTLVPLTPASALPPAPARGLLSPLLSRPLPDQRDLVAAGPAGVPLVTPGQDTALSLPALEKVDLLLVDEQIENAASQAGGVPQMPETQGSLSNVWRDSSDIEAPGHSQPVLGSVVENTPTETSVDLHGEVPPVKQQSDGVRPVVTQQLVAGDKDCVKYVTRHTVYQFNCSRFQGI